MLAAAVDIDKAVVVLENEKDGDEVPVLAAAEDVPE